MLSAFGQLQVSRYILCNYNYIFLSKTSQSSRKCVNGTNGVSFACNRGHHGRNFVVKCGGTAWYETNIVIGSMQK